MKDFEFGTVSFRFASASLFLILLLLNSFRPNQAIAAVLTGGPTTPTLVTNGACTSAKGSESDFQTTVNASGTEDLTHSGFDQFDHYLVDGNNLVLSQDTVTTLGSTAINAPFTLQNGTFETPTAGPFRFVIYKRSTGVIQFNQGDTANFVAGSILGEVTFDAQALDPDCPAGALTTGGTSGSTGPTSEQRTQTVSSLQGSFNSITPPVLGTDGLGLNGSGGSGNLNGVNFAPTGPIAAVGYADGRINAFRKTDGIGFAPELRTYSNNSFDFSVNLQQLAARMKAQKAKKTDGLGYGPEGGETAVDDPHSRWLTSVSGRYVDFEDGQTGADRDGHMWLVTSALGYRLTDSAIAGVFGRYRQGEVESTALSSKLESALFGGGAYLATTGPGGVRFVGAALYELGENDITISGATGNFDSTTLTLEGSLDKRFSGAKSWIEPSVKILYLHSENDDFTDSQGNLVKGATEELGRLSFGPKIGTTIGNAGQTTYSPYASINGIWDFEHADTVTTTTGASLTTGETALNLGGGLDIKLQRGLGIHVSGDWTAYNTPLRIWSVAGGMEGSFASLGFGDHIPGSLALNFAGNDTAGDASANVKIPLQ